MGNWRLEKLALYFSFGIVLAAGGIDYSTWQFWMAMIIVVVMDAVSVRIGREEGAAAVFDLSLDEIQRIKELVDGTKS